MSPYTTGIFNPASELTSLKEIELTGPLLVWRSQGNKSTQIDKTRQPSRIAGYYPPLHQSVNHSWSVNLESIDDLRSRLFSSSNFRGIPPLSSGPEAHRIEG